MKKNIYCLILFFSFFILKSQTKKPALFRWHDQHLIKHVKKHVPIDTLITTSQAIIHLNVKKDSLPYLLLLHGMGVNARSNWNSQVKSLSKKFNLIMPDLVYFGESTSLDEDFSLEFQAKQIHEAILKLGITKKIHVMGFSYGALTAAVYNELFHNQVDKLIIMDGPVKYYSTHISDSLANAVGVKNMTQILTPQTIDEFNSMQKAVMANSFPLTNKMKRKMIKHYVMPNKLIKDKQMNYLTVYQNIYQNYNYHLDSTSTLLIWGGKDGVIPASVGLKLHDTFPKTTQLIIYPNAKHDAHFSEAKKLNKAVINFLTTN